MRRVRPGRADVTCARTQRFASLSRDRQRRARRRLEGSTATGLRAPTSAFSIDDLRESVSSSRGVYLGRVDRKTKPKLRRFPGGALAHVGAPDEGDFRERGLWQRLHVVVAADERRAQVVEVERDLAGLGRRGRRRRRWRVLLLLQARSLYSRRHRRRRLALRLWRELGLLGRLLLQFLRGVLLELPVPLLGGELFLARRDSGGLRALRFAAVRELRTLHTLSSNSSFSNTSARSRLFSLEERERDCSTPPRATSRREKRNAADLPVTAAHAVVKAAIGATTQHSPARREVLIGLAVGDISLKIRIKWTQAARKGPGR